MKIKTIAEIGSNHNGDLNRAKRLIDSAWNAGADIVKFQAIKPELLFRKPQKSHKKLALSWAQFHELKNHTESHPNLEFMVTPFYLDAVDKLESMDIAMHKIASWDITYEPLIRKVGETGKPVFMSTGAANPDEIEQALEWLKPDSEDYDYSDVVLMHCTGGYPTPVNEANLRRILDLGTYFSSFDENGSEFIPSYVPRLGFSSHVINPMVVASSVMYGVEYIEVHYDLADREGIESAHSYTPDMFVQLKQHIQTFQEATRYEDCCSSQNSKFARINYRRDPSDWLRPVLSK